MSDNTKLKKNNHIYKYPIIVLIIALIVGVTIYKIKQKNSFNKNEIIYQELHVNHEERQFNSIYETKPFNNPNTNTAQNQRQNTNNQTAIIQQRKKQYILFGNSGVGKSSFVQTLAPYSKKVLRKCKIGLGVKSETQEITSYEITKDDNLLFGDQGCCMIDSMGLQDSEKSFDIEDFFTSLYLWINKLKGENIDGILVFQDGMQRSNLKRQVEFLQIAFGNENIGESLIVIITKLNLENDPEVKSQKLAQFENIAQKLKIKGGVVNFYSVAKSGLFDQFNWFSKEIKPDFQQQEEQNRQLLKALQQIKQINMSSFNHIKEEILNDIKNDNKVWKEMVEKVKEKKNILVTHWYTLWLYNHEETIEVEVEVKKRVETDLPPEKIQQIFENEFVERLQKKITKQFQDYQKNHKK